MKKIALIIGTLNDEETIGELIDSINKNTYKNREIIIVDGGSKDRTVEIAKKRGATVLIENGPNKCPANAWNQAINYTDAELVCLLGADFLLPDKRFIEKTVKAFNDPKVAGVYTNVKTSEDTLIEKIVSVSGTSMHPNVFRRDLALNTGGFPAIGFGEDRIFNMRFVKHAKKNGFRTEYLSDTYYGGHMVKTLNELYKQAAWYGRTSIIYLKEYYRESGSIGELLRETITINFKLIYFVLFIALIFYSKSEFFYYFFVPFMLISAAIILKNIRMPYRTLKVFTNLLSGFGFFIGVTSYILGLNNSRGRG